VKFTRTRSANPEQFLDPVEMSWRYPDREHIELSKALADGGAYYPPIVLSARGERMPRLVTGQEEVYAAALAGMKRITVLVLQGTLADAALIKDGPMNWMKIGDKIAVARRIATMENPTTGHLGRPKGPNRVMLEELAGEVGLTVEALLKRQKRKRAKARSEGLTEPEPVRSLGMRLTPAFSRQTTRAREIVQRTLDKVVDARRTLGSFGLDGIPFPVARLERIKDDFAELELILRASRPESICPACKATEALCGGCAMCVGLGYILENQLPNVPADLLDPRHPVVLTPEGPRPVGNLDFASGKEVQ